MDYLTRKKFTFSSAALSADTFGVVEFQGREGLSQCYEFQVLLVSENAEIDLARVIQNPATFTCHRMDGRTVEYHGIVLRFEQLHAVDRCAFYRASLAPRLLWLSLSRHNQVFLDQNVPEIIEACLKDGGLTGQDYEFRLQGDYPALEYVCQYNESSLDFISRWLEREGIYYWFEQGAEREKVIFTDTKIGHAAHPQGGAVSYAPPSGLETWKAEEVVQSFNCRCQLLPASVQVRDYNYRQPSLDVSGTADVDSGGRGQAYHYGERSLTPEEAKGRARLYAEALLCRREVFEGEGTAPYLSPGYTLELREHYRKSFNQSYLTTEVRHEGSQAGYLTAGLSQGAAGDRVFYRNSFAAIPAGVQYRPERKTARPQVAGTLTARVDAAGSGQYAELDAQGRYKVVLPFDLSGRRDGKASAWVRMATPYAGSDHGMHFPLHKGTEVLLSFRDGDPDRPVIAAAVPNEETPSPVTGANQTASEIRTGSGNRIQLEDAAGSERILLHSPKQPSFIRIGAPNDPSGNGDSGGARFGSDHTRDRQVDKGGTGSGDEYKTSTTHWGIAEKTDGWIELEAQGTNTMVLGESTSVILGLRAWLTGGFLTDAGVGGKWELHQPTRLQVINAHFNVTAENWKVYGNRVTTRALRQKFTGVETRISNRVSKAVGEQMRVATEMMRLDAEDVKLTGTTVGLQAESIRVHGEQLKAVATKMETIGSKLEDAGETLESVGSLLADSGTTYSEDGTHIRTAGTSLKDAGLAMKNAGSIIQN